MPENHQERDIINLNNRIIDENGAVLLLENGVLDAVTGDPECFKYCCTIETDETTQYNKWAKTFDLDRISYELPEINHLQNQQKWMIPEQYKELDLIEFLINKCSTEEQKLRVLEELEAYFERDLENLLRFLIYLVDVMRNNEIVWGVGRGSSVSSYILYLIGIHKIDSLKFKLHYSEFLK